jgi:hypothetical protein
MPRTIAIGSQRRALVHTPQAREALKALAAGAAEAWVTREARTARDRLGQ